MTREKMITICSWAISLVTEVDMGKQINYWMDYDSFLLIAEKALEFGCIIYRRKSDKNGKLIYGTSIDVVTEEEKDYFFYFPEAGEIEIEQYNGREVVGHRLGKASNAIIEAGYSYVNDKTKSITRSRIYCTTGYYSDDGSFVNRPEALTKVFNSLARCIKKVTPYTESHDLSVSIRDDNYGQPYDYIHKEYLSPWCLQKKNEGYTLQG